MSIYLNCIDCCKIINTHYLNRYKSFIIGITNRGQVSKIKGTYAKHHIAPKSLFPEYKNFREHPDNLIILSHREHFIAHKILAKALQYNMAYAFRLMCADKFNKKYTKSKDYDMLATMSYASESRKEMVRRIHTGKITSEETKAKMRESNKNRNNPKRGDSFKEKQRLARAGKPSYTKNRIWIYKDECSRMIYPADLDSFLIFGWKQGRPPKTPFKV